MNPADGSKLEKASRAGDAKVIQQLLPKIDVKQPADKAWLDGSLEQAVYGKSVEAVELLLKSGANPNQNTSSGTLLAYPAGNGDLPMVKCLVKGGANYNRVFKRETALSDALAYSQVPVIEYLEKLGAYSPPDITLFFACANGDIKRAKKALTAGADVEKTGGTFGETPLMAAARKGQVEAVKLLLKHGANPNQRKGGQSVLFGAIKYGKNLEVFELLVAAGANIHAKYYGETLLMTAAQAGCLPLVKRLVELGIKVNPRDKNVGATALDVAKMHKHKEVVAYLNSIGAKADRDACRAMMKALSKEYGGKPDEHSDGFLLNSKFIGNVCQFHAYPGTTVAAVYKLRYKDAELKHAHIPGLIFGGEVQSTNHLTKPGKKVAVKTAGKFLGIQVRRAAGKKAVPEKYIMDFCRRHKGFFSQLNLASLEQVGITSEAARFFWTGTDIKTILPRLRMFERFLREISHPPEPERRLFENEWLLKPAPKTSGVKPVVVHTLGGALDRPVFCPHCGLATNLMAQIDLADPLLPKNPLGSRKLPVFWCMNCLEWDPTFFDLSSPTLKAIVVQGKAAKAEKDQTGEEDLPECRVMLVPVPKGRKAGHKSKIGGSPKWIQSESTPDCPKCEKSMAFVLQLASDSRISYCDMGILYAFACSDCKATASLIQSH
ncbi:MAG: ankyrin repeat and protein mask-like [Pedosphaera sp.]|nr:ankyrin repeat and protein mask-like [Pedosphaera sp.]